MGLVPAIGQTESASVPCRGAQRKPWGTVHLPALRRHHEQDIAFTVDILGEAVVSESEAGRCAQRYLDLMEVLGRETARWPRRCRSNLSPRGPVPVLNLSVKLSALYSQIHPADPDTAVAAIGGRLRPILRRAKELGALINLDMESYALKDLTVRVFKTLFAQPEFASAPACGPEYLQHSMVPQVITENCLRRGFAPVEEE